MHERIMSKEEFIEELNDDGYSYEIVGDKLIVTHSGGVNLGSLKTLPSGVEFNNGGNVNLGSLETLPSGVEFKNGGNVYLGLLKTLPSGVEFKNRGSVDLSSLETLPSDVEFKNGGEVYLKKLTGGWFSKWKGNIEGIENKTLLNMMIKKGVFL